MILIVGTSISSLKISKVVRAIMIQSLLLTIRNLRMIQGFSTKTTGSFGARISPRKIISSSSSSSSSMSTKNNDTANKIPIIVIPEEFWRREALQHKNRILNILKPGLTSKDDVINSGSRRNQRQKRKESLRRGYGKYDFNDEWTSLDSKNPIYNFLIEYYGITGAKGPKRLARWCPDPSLLLVSRSSSKALVNIDDTTDCETSFKKNAIFEGIKSCYSPSSSEWIENEKKIQFLRLLDEEGEVTKSDNEVNEKNEQYDLEAIISASKGYGGIFLENATEDDMGGYGTLHLRGAIPVLQKCDHNDKVEENDSIYDNNKLLGVLYNPAIFYDKRGSNNPTSITTKDEEAERRIKILKTIAPFEWFMSILKSTLNSEPILHCHGLHEWAMQYHPPNAPPPPSAIYQGNKNLPLRVSREVINATVERRGISCTHVDALRFFAPAAGPLNHHGSSLQRTDQLKLEQKGCVHAHMDLLKIVLKIQPFVNVKLIADVLELSLKARKLDVEASPYDATQYPGVGIVPVETKEGRKLYRKKQTKLMEEAEPVRKRLLESYEDFLQLTFEEEFLSTTVSGSSTTSDSSSNMNNGYAAPERFSKAEPGSLPWRRNLIIQS